ncbi:UNVERIFIED_CONTAM: hypothetical protein K2H54_046562 [Gekko kuhli]
MASTLIALDRVVTPLRLAEHQSSYRENDPCAGMATGGNELPLERVRAPQVDQMNFWKLEAGGVSGCNRIRLQKEQLAQMLQEAEMGLSLTLAAQQLP